MCIHTDYIHNISICVHAHIQCSYVHEDTYVHTCYVHIYVYMYVHCCWCCHGNGLLFDGSCSHTQSNHTSRKGLSSSVHGLSLSTVTFHCQPWSFIVKLFKDDPFWMIKHPKTIKVLVAVVHITDTAASQHMHTLILIHTLTYNTQYIYIYLQYIQITFTHCMYV